MNDTNYKAKKVDTKDELRDDSLFFERDDNRDSINSREIPPLQSLQEDNKKAVTTLKTTTVLQQKRTNLDRTKNGKLFQIQSENIQRDSVVSNNLPSNQYGNSNDRNGGNLFQNVDRNVVLSQGINNPSQGIGGNLIKVVNRNPSNNLPSYVSDQLRNAANENMNMMQRNQILVQPSNMARDAFIQQPVNNLPIQQPGIIGQPGNQVNQVRMPGNQGMFGQPGIQAGDSVANQLANAPQYHVNRITGLSVGGKNPVPGQQGSMTQQHYNQNFQQNNIAGQPTMRSGLPSREELANMDFAELSAIYHR